MGVLKSLNTASLIYLKPVHIFGRDPNVADTVLCSGASSRMHCVIRWQAGAWFLTDESKNGCFVNGNRIEQGHGVRLSRGDIFSTEMNGDSQWVLSDDSQPKAVILSEDAVSYRELQVLNILPDEERPECQVLQQGTQWFFEKEHDFYPITEGFRMTIEGEDWLFYPNHLLDETAFSGVVTEVLPTLTFNVSRNEENIQLIFELGTKIIDLGHKTHHYLLLEMARYLQSDPAPLEKERGWVSNDWLLHQLRIDINNLNIQIYRARKAINECSHYWGQNLIQRRRGEIRLSPCAVKIN